MRSKKFHRSKQMTKKTPTLSTTNKIKKRNAKKIQRIVLKRLESHNVSNNENSCVDDKFPENKFHQYQIVEKLPRVSENLENHNNENYQSLQAPAVSCTTSSKSSDYSESGLGSTRESSCQNLPVNENLKIHEKSEDVFNDDMSKVMMMSDDEDDFESFTSEYDNQFAAVVPTIEKGEESATPDQTSITANSNVNNEDNEEEEILEEIIEDIWDVTIRSNENGNFNMKFLVKWDNWSAEDNTYEPFEHVSHAEVLHDYVKRKFEFHADRIQTGIEKLCVTDEHMADRFSKKSRNCVLKKFESFDLLYFKCSILAYLYTYKPVPIDCPFVKKLICNCLIYKAMQTKDAQEKYHEQKASDLMANDDKIVSLRIENKVDFATIPNFVYLRNVEDVERKLENIGCKCENGCNNRSSECCPKLLDLSTVFDWQGALNAKSHQLIVECSEFCKCDVTKCTNHIIRPQLKLCIFKTARRGWGLKTLEYIPAGTFVVEYTGELINAEDAKKRTTRYKRKGILDQFMFDLDYNDKSESFYSIDATLKGNLSRFINHSCNANLQTWPAVYASEDKNKHRLYYFSLRGIRANEELTIDYFGGVVSSQTSKKVPVNAKPCKCEAINCRGLIF